MSVDDLSLEHQDAFVMSFIISERRERYMSKLKNSKHRSGFLDRLPADLDKRYIVEGPQRHDPLAATSCYIIAAQDQFDGKLVTPTIAQDFLDAALFGIVVSYIPGKLVAYKDESPSEVVWLERW